jgi:hypothetical protein
MLEAGFEACVGQPSWGWTAAEISATHLLVIEVWTALPRSLPRARLSWPPGQPRRGDVFRSPMSHPLSINVFSQMRSKRYAAKDGAPAKAGVTAASAR